jgi:signal transduction histidine kinase
VTGAAADLEREARRLRFTDAEWERRFDEERQSEGLTRARSMMVLGLLVVCAMGDLDTALNARSLPEYALLSLQLRFLAVAPVWLAMLVSTALAGHRARADGVYAAGTTLIAWALGLVPWGLLYYLPGANVAQPLIVNVLAVLLISLAALPMRFAAVAGMVVASIGGIIALFWAGAPLANAYQVWTVTATLSGIGLLVLVLGGYREVAERRMFGQREQVRTLNAELARLNAEKNEFMAIASHDLRAPLASVRGLAEQLCDGQLADPARRKQALGAIHELAGRMLGLVDDYLGAHAAESGTVPVRRERIDLQETIAQAGLRHDPVARNKAQQVKVSAGPSVRAHADAGMLAQVLDNFVSNAMKFSPQGATVELGVAVAEDGRVARLEVTDEGPGIASEDQGGLFRKFSRTGAKPTGGETSYGLGLAVTKRLAETMGGRVGCDSPVGAGGKGARFWIELPTCP